ncbi:hypothetical protein FGO68_gene12426 [Halteria grandinella]|uniref:Uncharacterized protein n=1 Tax=Halteria grandinella TaxID=5974 RepID=A0A8J8T704_HALGN|nr:hypothetical protein FGO68_gene12426 [Halteria grandinella]
MMDSLPLLANYSPPKRGQLGNPAEQMYGDQLGQYAKHQSIGRNQEGINGPYGQRGPTLQSYRQMNQPYLQMPHESGDNYPSKQEMHNQPNLVGGGVGNSSYNYQGRGNVNGILQLPSHYGFESEPSPLINKRPPQQYPPHQNWQLHRRTSQLADPSLQNNHFNFRPPLNLHNPEFASRNQTISNQGKTLPDYNGVHGERLPSLMGMQGRNSFNKNSTEEIIQSKINQIQEVPQNLNRVHSRRSGYTIQTEGPNAGQLHLRKNGLNPLQLPNLGQNGFASSGGVPLGNLFKEPRNSVMSQKQFPSLRAIQPSQQDQQAQNPSKRQSDLDFIKNHVQNQQQLLLKLAQDAASLTNESPLLSGAEKEKMQQMRLKKKLIKLRNQNQSLNHSVMQSILLSQQKQAQQQAAAPPSITPRSLAFSNMDNMSVNDESEMKQLTSKLDAIEDAFKKNAFESQLLQRQQMMMPPQMPYPHYPHANPGLEQELSRQKEMLEKIMEELKNKQEPKPKQDLSAYGSRSAADKEREARELERVKKGYEDEIKRLANQLREKDEQKQKMRNRDDLALQLAKMEDKPVIRVKKGSKRYLKAIVRVIIEWTSLMKRIRKPKMMMPTVDPQIARRDAVVNELDIGLKQATEQIKQWIIKSTQPLMTEFLQDQQLSLNIIEPVDLPDTPALAQGRQVCLSKANNVLKSLLTQLLDGLQSFPFQTQVFLANLSKPDQFIPNNFLSEFEMKRIDLTTFGAIRTCGYPQRCMMMGGLVLIKVLICRVFSQSNFANLIQAYQLQPFTATRYNGPRFNLKLISSLFYYLVVEYLETLLQTKGYSEDLIWTCGLRNIKSENYKVRCELFNLLETFLKSLNQMLVRHINTGSQTGSNYQPAASRMGLQPGRI